MPYSIAESSGVTVIVAMAENISSGQDAGLSLVFAAGQRPGLDTLAGLAGRSLERIPFALSNIPGAGENWVELLASGLTFDCRGLAPDAAATMPGKGAMLGLHELPQGETIVLQPSPHLAEGRGLLPVVRTLVGLGAQLGELPGFIAAHWQPARCWMAAKFFRGVVNDWLGGGAFPALGLVSLQREKDGAMVSAGLDYLIGQELSFAPNRRLEPAAVARIAVRLIHSLVDSGPLRAPSEYVGPEGEILLVEPVKRGKELKVSVRRA